jgi:mannose-6-phosphate isomerase-like protein (cupin superfamily)
MICRHYTEGQKINVADLNEITVLVDRSQTALTEVGWNKWKPGLDGPPHSHDRKEQIFYVTAGHGTVVVGGERFSVKPGDLVYVPPCVVHQTITQGGEPLCYFLFNAFLGADKEGHASFADHLDKVKHVRKKQAESGSADADGTARTSPANPGKHIGDLRKGRVFDFGSNTTIPLLQRSDTSRAEVTLVTWPKGNKGAMVAHKEKEQTFFVLSGVGKITIADETKQVGPGDVVFVPWNTPHTTEATDQELTYLVFNNYVVETKDRSFEEMYQRLAPQRLERWKAGSTAAGE